MRFWTLLLALIGLRDELPPLAAQVAPRSTISKADAWRQRKDYALLFATNEYDTGWEPLSNPIPDANALAKELQDNYGFITRVVENPTRDRVRLELRDYSSKDLGEADQLFIFFAGHGVFDEVFHQGYIVTKDSRRDDDARSSYTSYNDLKGMIASMRAKHVLLVVDACFSGTLDHRIAESATRGSDMYASLTFPQLFANKVRYNTRKFIASGGKDYVFDGLPGHNSPFVSHLLEELRTYGGDQGFITFNNVLTAVERTNPEPRWGEFEGDDPGSDFFFVSKQLDAKLRAPSAPASASGAEGTAVARGSSGSMPSGRPAIAVLGFRNLSGKQEDTWLSTAISEWLTTELGAGQRLRVIAGESVSRVKQDLGLPDSSGYAKDTLKRIYNTIGSQYVVSGSYMAMPGRDQIRVDPRLQDAASGELIAALPPETGSREDLSELVQRIGVRLRAKLGVESITKEEAKAVKAALPSKTEFSKAYAEGLQKLRAYDLLAARNRLQDAVKADPKSALAHQALGQAWLELGYDSKAREEAATAVDLSGNLSRPQTAAIEASYRKMNAQWDLAIKSYLSLWTIFPDETDYALELADVQTKAGKAREALGTLDTLRSQSKDAGDDPRVDLEEAVAASSLSDFKRKQEAAARAAEKATKLGARLLAAQANWQNCSALLSLGDQKGAEDACAKASQDATFSGAGRQIEARSYTVLANIRVAQGRYSEAMELRKNALGIARDIGSRIDIIGALVNLANLQYAQGQLDDAKENYKEAIRLALETDDKLQLVKAQLGMANVLYDQADYSGAEEMWQQARQGATQLGDRRNVAKSSINLATLALQLGDLQKAEDNVRQSMAVAQDSGLQLLLAPALRTLGDVLAARGDLSGARKQYEESLMLFTRLNAQPEIATNRLLLSGVALEEGDFRRAEELARPALEAFVSQRSVDDEASAHETLARVLIAQGKQEQAIEEINAAKTLAPQDNAVRVAVAITAARLSAWKGNLTEARQSLENSFREASRMKLVGAQMEIRLAQAEIERASDQPSARAHLQSLALDAKNSGYLLIAAKAARLQQPR